MKRLALVVLSLVISIGFAEGLLRIYFWTKGIGRADVYDVLARSQRTGLSSLHGGAGLFGLVQPSPLPGVVYEVKPLLKGRWRENYLETNRFGMRGPELERGKPARTFRIVGLGDSHMFGSGVGQDETYVRLLERRLNQHAVDGYRFEVLNFGTPGYSTVMEAALFEGRALEFDPDLVLIHFIGNDFNPPHFLRPQRDLAPSRLYLVEMVRGLRFRRSDEDWDEEPDEVPTRRERRSASEYQHMGGQDAYREAMQRLRRLTAVRRIPLILFLLSEDSPQRRYVRDVAQELGVPFLNTSPYFALVMRERGGGQTFKQAFVRTDDHPKPLGHEAYARALFCELRYFGVPHLSAPAQGDCLPEPLAEPFGIAPPAAGGAQPPP